MQRAKQPTNLRDSLRRAGVTTVALFATLCTLSLDSRLSIAEESDLPAVARAHFSAEGRAQGGGTCFFIPVSPKDFPVAVCTAHAFNFAELALSETVEFRLGFSKELISNSTKFFSRAGRSFTLPDSSLLNDLMIFKLKTTPSNGIKILEASLAPSKIGDKVTILGIPFNKRVNQAELNGVITRSDSSKIEVKLEKISDLRGWGGGPALNKNGRVVGLLQAALKKTVFLTPIAAVQDRVRTPISGPESNFSSLSRKEYQPQEEEQSTAPPSINSLPASGKLSLSGPKIEDSSIEKLAIILDVEHPRDQSIANKPTGVFIAGKAHAHSGKLRLFDVIFVIDTSGSTKQLTGTDVNRNGIVGKEGFFGVDDEGDSILAAEIAAAIKMLNGLDSRSTRVGVITFAGDPRTGFPPRLKNPAARTEEPLTSDFAKIEMALGEIAKRKSAGMTHMAAGIDQATIELLGLRGSLSEKRPYSEKIVLFFTDGRPTLPYDQVFVSENVKSVLRAADRSARANIKIHSFAIGPEALEGPIATVEMAARTEGYFTPVRDPGELAEIAQTVNFANVDQLIVENKTTGIESNETIINADGSWAALINLKAGKNIIRVTALANDGSREQEEILLHYAPDAPSVELPREFVSRRNQLLEQKLIKLRRESDEMINKTRRELRVEIERERDLANRRAADQRRELEIRIEPLRSGQQEIRSEDAP